MSAGGFGRHDVIGSVPSVTLGHTASCATNLAGPQPSPARARALHGKAARAMRALRSLTLVLMVSGCAKTEAASSAEADEPVVELAPVAEVGAPIREGHRAPTEAMGLPEPPTTLPLALLATMASADPEQARATIRDEERKVVATFRAGDLVRDGVRLSAVHRRFAILQREGGEHESLVMENTTVELTADDVFYPDLLDDLDLPNSMADAVQLTPGPGYIVKKPVFAWGTPRTVHLLRETARLYTRRFHDGPPVRIGDISKKEGGPFPPHVSHQTGRDVDIGYVLHGAQSEVTRFVPATARNLDRARTWALVDALLSTDGVSHVFMDYEIQAMLYEHAKAEGVAPERLARLFQYPHGRYAWNGIIRHWKGHHDHLHVRFKP